MVSSVLAYFSLAVLLMSESTTGFSCIGQTNWNEVKSVAKMAEGLRVPVDVIVDPNYEELVKFFLFTRSTDPKHIQLFVGDADALKGSGFDMNRPTKIVVHGYINNVDSDVIQKIKNAFLGVEDVNVIAVDWGLIANTAFYHVAAEQTEPVGHYLGAFIEFLLGQGVRPEDVHVVGHSLGAHVAGFAGASLNFTKLARISGLDPAKPCFYQSPPDLRLDSSDALFVDCIHTCGGYLGLMENICHADFYPNGGTDVQPGCSLATLGVCSHDRSYDIYAESITPTHLFPSLECTEIPSKSSDGCKDSTNLMGYQASPAMPGIFYSVTRDSPPFSFNVTMF